MSGRVIKWPKQVSRAWVMVEIQPSKWRGELRQRGRKPILVTEEGVWVLVRDTIISLSNGLPIYERPYTRGTAA